MPDSIRLEFELPIVCNKFGRLPLFQINEPYHFLRIEITSISLNYTGTFTSIENKNTNAETHKRKEALKDIIIFEYKKICEKLNKSFAYLDEVPFSVLCNDLMSNLVVQ